MRSYWNTSSLIATRRPLQHSCAGTARWCGACAAGCSAATTTPKTLFKPASWCSPAGLPRSRPRRGWSTGSTASRTRPRKARASRARKLAREKQVTEVPEPVVDNKDPWHDLRPILDQELCRLPEKYRSAIVLCDLEGQSRKEAARQLALPEGTLSGRLTRGRTMLAKRLARHGAVVTGTALAALLPQEAAAACVPEAAAATVIKAASVFTAGKAAATAVVVPAKVAALTEGVLRTMWMLKAKVAMAVMAGVAAAGTGYHLAGGGCPLQCLNTMMGHETVASVNAAASPTAAPTGPAAPQPASVGQPDPEPGIIQHVHQAAAAHLKAARRAFSGQ